MLPCIPHAQPENAMLTSVTPEHRRLNYHLLEPSGRQAGETVQLKDVEHAQTPLRGSEWRYT
jgi:hypothetical protein